MGEVADEQRCRVTAAFSASGGASGLLVLSPVSRRSRLAIKISSDSMPRAARAASRPFGPTTRPGRGGAV
jgi:hypothetical protein